MRATALAVCLALSGPALLPFAGARDFHTVEDPAEPLRQDLGQHLAVVVPVYRGDLSRAVSSLERWPSTCSPLTEKNADLVLYYAEGEEDAPTVTAAVDTIRETAGHCFAETRLVYAHLSDEEDVYPKGPSVMFFKMFLDEGVHNDLSEYDALAIIEWDVLVASDRSFEELHYAAFRGHEDFWVKGSNLGGTNFHSTAQVSDMWKVLGHINGNAIYNNNDPDFVEYVDYTRTRWGYTYPYDVALWLTISDFPYSWPLWQRYSTKFVTTNLISYVGFEHVDHSTVSNAVAGQTLFIHGSRVDEGNLASLEATKHERKQTRASIRRLSNSKTAPPACNAACGSEDAAGLPVGTSTVCDDTCAGISARFGGFLCGAGDEDRFGSMCRLCFVDVEEARRQEQSLALTRSDIENGEEASHIIMCETMRPPEAAECSDKCGRKKDTVCDEACGTGRHGDYNCSWRDHGPKCRFCFNDLESALMADEVAKRRGGRVIMCSTLEPPQTSEMTANVVHIGSRTEEDITNPVVRAEALAGTSPSRELQTDLCDEVNCPHTNSNGFRGRVCDSTCADGVPFGTNGCGARDGRHGPNCRVCYLDVDRALANDDPDNRAIMCDTGLPVDPNNCDEVECTHTNSNGFRGRICDASCASGIPFGTNGCGARQGRHGPNCRVCYNDVDRALANDDPDNRAIMCDTMMPVEVDPTPDTATCDEEECPHMNSNGFRGRVCDPSCADGVPFGTNGCGAREGRHGENCRVCYFDIDRAISNDAAEDRAIMCDTLRPVTVYPPDSRRLSAATGGSPRLIGIKLKAWKDSPASAGDVNETPMTEENVESAVVQGKSLAGTSPSRKLQDSSCDEIDCPHTNSNGFRGRVCDPTCADGVPFGTNGCGARDGRHGPNCRVCYFDVDRALANDDPDNRAIMCDTVMPVEPNDCDEEECPHTNSNGFRGRVCDPSCADGVPFGTNGCGAREGRHGPNCRVCYNDVDRALANDDPDNRAIMCDTLSPVGGDTPTPEPATCDEVECPHRNSNGFRGRECDPTCADGDPFGTNGCGAREGRHGENCRVCYVDFDRAVANDAAGDRAIMCDTLEPVTVYPPDSRRLSSVAIDSAWNRVTAAAVDADDANSLFNDATILPYVNDLVRGNLCAFFAGDQNEVDQVEVAVRSVLQFVPGMRVAVAADDAGFHSYQRAVGVFPGVTVYSTDDLFTASLLADEYCGVDTSLILYMRSNSLVSRPFTSKDTHSIHGELLVVHGTARTSYVDREIAKQTTAVLGFQSPSFTFNTDLFLPVAANADLREVLMSGHDNEQLEGGHGSALNVLQAVMKLRNMSAVPQLMAALAYSRNTPGVWFVDPKTWVSEHLFRTASIWEIPLVKPRYTCSIDPLIGESDADGMDVGLVLQTNLAFFTHGGTCDSGYIDFRRD